MSVTRALFVAALSVTRIGAADVTLLLEHPAGTKHNTKTRHAQGFIGNLPRAGETRKGVAVYVGGTGAVHKVTREGRVVPGIREVGMRIGQTGPMAFTARQQALIRRMDFEQGVLFKSHVK